jgi:glycosyltransferase involved in cell wall biosynthesis/peptidoglycan/xylan/chitin deacetylase (PgdA/CDA1 family)
MRDRMASWLGERAPIKQVTDWICQSGSTIFLFHRVLPKEEPFFEPELSTELSVFSDFLDWIDERYRVISVDELVARQQDRCDRKRPLCAITFDDGWVDNYRYAFPELSRRKMPATIFLPFRFIGTRRRFWQELMGLFFIELQKNPSLISTLEHLARRSPWFPPFDSYRGDYIAVRRLLLSRPGREAWEFAEQLIETAGLLSKLSDRSFLNWNEVEEMRNGSISFGSHTMNHMILTTAPPATGEEEIRLSREELERQLKGKVSGFSYPWGAIGRSSHEQVRQSGYGYAVTTRPGLVKQDTDPYLLPRIPISDSILNGGFGEFSPGKARLSFTKNILKHRSDPARTRIGIDSQKKIKILFVIDLISEWEGGTERQLHLLINSLDRRYFEPKICFIYEAPELPLASLPCPLLVVSRKDQDRLSAPQRFLKLVEILKSERPDIVQTFFREGILVGVAAARIAGVPKVILSIRNEGTWQNYLHRFSLRHIALLVSRCQTNSRALWRKEFEKGRLRAPAIDILPNGSDLSRFRPASTTERRRARRQLELDENSYVGVSVANLSEVKDIPTLLQGARIVRDKIPNSVFLVVGGGPLQTAMEQKAEELGLNGSVRFVGRQPDVRSFLAAADVGVLTSKSEGSSNAVIEYMAAGLPTVLSDIEPNRELVEGVFFRRGDPVDFAAKVTQVAADKELCGALSATNVRMAREFDLVRFEERVQGYYNQLASEVED